MKTNHGKGLKLKESKDGITLIALVITIIVLLILAGVSIATLTGENGILTKVNDAKIAQIHAEVKEAMALQYNEYQIYLRAPKESAKQEKELVKIAATQVIKVAETQEQQTKSFKEFLLEKGIIDSEGVINVEKLVGKKLNLGNGTAGVDVYKLEEKDGKTLLNYYDEKGTVIENVWSIEGNLENNEGIVYLDPDEWEYVIDPDTNTATLLEYKGNDDVIVVPNYIKTETGNVEVKKIGNGSSNIWDQNNSDIYGYYYKSPSFVRKIIISPGISSINDFAFMDTINLQEVSISESVTYIGQKAFWFCKNLASVYFKQTTAPILGPVCFYYPTGSTSGITFYFKNSTVSDALIDGTHYSSSCGTKSTDYNWEDDYQDSNPDDLNPEEWTYEIDENTNTATLLKYSGSDSIVIVPSYIETEEGNVAVKKIGNGSSSIWDDSICDYKGIYYNSPSFITKIIISSGITDISALAFMDTINLQEVSISESVTNIGASAFSKCAKLARVYFNQTTAPTFGNVCFYDVSTSTQYYFKNSTVSDALIYGTHYNAGTKSTDYNW